MKKFIPFKLIALITIIMTFSDVKILSCQEINTNRTYQLQNGELFIPAVSELNKDKITLIIHLHGKTKFIEELYLRTNLPYPLISLHLGMLSGPYRIAFSDTNFLRKILDEALGIIKKETQKEVSSFKLNLIFTSFSAGYGGIREILKTKTYYEMTSAIILLDGLHTDYVYDNGEKIVNPEQMKDFLRFARDAVKFTKQFIITHSEIIPEGYSSTTETAQYLIDSTFTEKISAERKWADDFIQKYYAFNGNFRVFGFYGNTAKDHMQHLYNLPQFLKMINFK
ncbi:MAG: hypothetical protein HPY57_04000 [Ignavibacteria bacterium]|nr:hypothetical protein [Ignavibacteria bacterium]